MAADETRVDEAPAQLSLTEKLARFLHDAYLGAGEAGLAEINTPQPWDELDEGMRNVSTYIAEAVLQRFFRVDSDARTLYATSGVDSDTLVPFARVHWGALFGRMNIDQLRAVGAAFVEVAEQAEIEAAMARWLLRDGNATVESVSRIIQSFRVFRAELDAQPDEMPSEPSNVAPDAGT